MTKINFTAYPKPWEIVVAKTLSLPLGFAQFGVLVYIVVLLCGPIIWTQILLLGLLNIAIGFCYRNVAAILKRVSDVDDPSGE